MGLSTLLLLALLFLPALGPTRRLWHDGVRLDRRVAYLLLLLATGLLAIEARPLERYLLPLLLLLYLLPYLDLPARLRRWRGQPSGTGAGEHRARSVDPTVIEGSSQRIDTDDARRTG